MPNPPAANLAFVPWVRRGAAAAIDIDETRTAQQPAAATVRATLALNGAALPPMALRLRGPADVQGIDARQVVRMDPPPQTTDFEPNLFASVEFDRPDFPWLFTPARADAAGRLRPWLVLAVVREGPGVAVAPPGIGPLPVLRVGAPARPIDELPDLAESWAWVHAQAAAGDASLAQVKAAMNGAPELSLSRLLCPRRLEPNVDYLAAVVPAFELGRRTGLGSSVTDAELTVPNALAPAWSFTPAPPAGVELPVYLHWRFRTGPGGDFASLVQKLEPRTPPAGLGRRLVSIARPGFELTPALPAATTLGFDGALRPAKASTVPAPWPDKVQERFETELANIVNAPGANASVAPNADPLLAPPLYGRWHAARPAATRGGPTWFDELNLDPRLRAVAALGTLVVQQHQEALMASAWEQAAALREANQRLRQLQLGLSVATSLHLRHFKRLDADAALRLTAPAHGRIRFATAADPVPRTLLARIAESPLPLHAAAVAMRRIGRERGPITRRAASRAEPRIAGASWLAKVGASGLTFLALPRVTAATLTGTFVALPATTRLKPFREVTDTSVRQATGRPFFSIAAERAPVAAPPNQTFPQTVDSVTARDFRIAAAEHLARVNPARALPPIALALPLVLGDFSAPAITQLEPRATLRALARAVVAAGPNASPAVDTPASDAAGIDTVMAAPRFEQPMYEALRDLDAELLLPGMQDVLPDTVLGLQTNRRFVEAYLVGLNVEMAGELLWRGYPTDQRGTCFDRFWGTRPEIEPVHRWGTRKLGEQAGAPARERFVMLLRSALLRRYPNAVIYLTRALVAGGTRKPSLAEADEIHPAFRGELPPDVTFFGFDIDSGAVAGSDGSGGYYVVIQEHPTEPRFGLDVGTPAGSATHLAVAGGPPPGVAAGPQQQWGRNGAHIAGILRRAPVRIAIHASKLVTP